jgi:hypothetical protein
MIRHFEPLREREFRILFTGRLVSLVGNGVAPIGLAFAVFELGGSGTELGLVLAASTVPQLVFLVAAGSGPTACRATSSSS